VWRPKRGTHFQAEHTINQDHETSTIRLNMVYCVLCLVITVLKPPTSNLKVALLTVICSVFIWATESTGVSRIAGVQAETTKQKAPAEKGKAVSHVAKLDVSQYIHGGPAKKSKPSTSVCVFAKYCVIIVNCVCVID